MRLDSSRISAILPQLISRLPAWAGEASRFLIGGALNLIVGYGTYLLLLPWLTYEAAYAIAYVVGIIVSYVFSALFVFRQPMRLRSAIRYPLVYLVQFLFGLILLRVSIEIFRLPTWLAPLFVSVLTIPTTFLMSRMILRSK